MLTENIKKLCIRDGISIAELESRLSIGNGNIARWNVNRPSVDRVKLVADYFGCTVDELLREEE